MTNVDSRSAGSFRFVSHWQMQSRENDDAVLQFWEREDAFTKDINANERLKELVLDARDHDGRVAGVCTVVPMTLPRMGQPLYYYRCFIGAKWRDSRLVYRLLVRAFDVLEAYARTHDYPCIGVLLELENERFDQTLRAPVWPGIGFVYVGPSGRGLDMRVRYFRGAKLKPVSA
ncbi:MAG: hypothetical protein ABI304_02335 [Rudaea sp.]